MYVWATTKELKRGIRSQSWRQMTEINIAQFIQGNWHIQL